MRCTNCVWINVDYAGCFGSVHIVGVEFKAFVVILSLSASSLAAGDTSLVSLGESWRFFRGTNEPSDPTNAWRQAGFDDSHWEVGISGFSSGGDEGTAFPISPSFRSAYFRKTFTVADPGSIHWLILRLDYASGFVAYLNGREILRRGLGG